jgi:hypothetical protein
MPSLEQSLPLAYPLLAAAHDGRLFKAKSEFALPTDKEHLIFRDLAKKLRSRSLEQFSGLAIWNCVPIVVSLEKDSRGLGFSVIDYQDPLHHKESVIVIRLIRAIRLKYSECRERSKNYGQKKSLFLRMVESFLPNFLLGWRRSEISIFRALVPAGVAQADGRITPGDRLLFVNDVDLSNSTLQNAVDVLKKAPRGLVKIGIAKPVSLNEVCLHLNLPKS